MTHKEQSYIEHVNVVYNKYGVPLHNQNLPVHIFGTSSKGNSVYIKPIRTVIDLGLPYKTYEDYDMNFFLHVDYIILTHEHGDHLVPSTLLKILEMFPRVKVLIHPRMAQAIISDTFQHRLKREKLQPYIDSGRFISAATACTLKTRDGWAIEFKPYIVSHGEITNIAIELYMPQLNNTLMLYASDLDTLHPKLQDCGCYCECKCSPQNKVSINGLPYQPRKKYDIMFLEANYNTEKLNEALDLNPKDEKAKGNLRHISEEEAQAYVMYHLEENGVFIPLHASSTFGSLIQTYEDALKVK